MSKKAKSFEEFYSKNKDGCSYNYEYASKKTVKKYVDSLNYEEIQDKLNSIMNL